MVIGVAFKAAELGCHFMHSHPVCAEFLRCSILEAIDFSGAGLGVGVSACWVKLDFNRATQVLVALTNEMWCESHNS